MCKISVMPSVKGIELINKLKIFQKHLVIKDLMDFEKVQVHRQQKFRIY